MEEDKEEMTEAAQLVETITGINESSLAHICFLSQEIYDSQ